MYIGGYLLERVAFRLGILLFVISCLILLFVCLLTKSSPLAASGRWPPLGRYLQDVFKYVLYGISKSGYINS